MAIRSYNVEGYERSYPSNEVYSEIKQAIITATNRTIYDLRELRVYNMNNKRKFFKAGNRDSFAIFLNATPYEGNNATHPRSLSSHPTMFGIEVVHGNRAHSYRGDSGTVLRTPEGEELGIYFDELHELYIYHDFQQYPTAKFVELIKATFDYLKAEIFDKKGMENSWIHSASKELLMKRFEERIKSENERNLEQDKDRLRYANNNAQDYQRKLKQEYDQIARLMKSIASVEEGNTSIQEKLVAEMNSIASHDRISDLRVEGDHIIVSVPDVITTDLNDYTYKMGDFQIKINLSNSDVRFFGSETRQGYWTDHDPHPHVNGDDGTACLGNVSSTIAELCSQNEIYALVLTAIDFLENANNEDSAGRNVVRWTRLDENGNEIEPEDMWQCERCENSYHDSDESCSVYNEFSQDRGIGISEETWCQGCRDDYASYHERADELLSDDAYSDADHYFEEQDREEEEEDEEDEE